MRYAPIDHDGKALETLFIMTQYLVGIHTAFLTLVTRRMREVPKEQLVSSYDFLKAPNYL